MEPTKFHFSKVCPWSGRLILAILLLVLTRIAYSEQPPSNSNTTSLRVDQLEQRLQSVIEENQRLSAEINTLKEQASFRLPEAPLETDSTEYLVTNTADTNTSFRPAYTIGYDNGFFVSPEVIDEHPFSLKINSQTTFRYSGFARDANTWTDSSGNVNSIFNSSTAMIPRGRLIFSGKAFLPDLSYLLNIDYNTVSNNPIGFRAYALSYKFSRAIEMHVGQNKVPGSREWLTSSWDAQEGPDRSMATTFFRPSLSQGIWLTGEPLNSVYYHAMVSNGFNTLNQTPNQINSRVCCSESIWWEPWGEFGKGYSDIQHHEDMALRIGASLSNTKEEGSQASDFPENSSVRLSDGTLITQVGALAPGVTLQGYSLSLLAIDLSYKYRGFSLSTELYFQELGALRGNGPLPMSSISSHGGVLQGGYFIVPQSVEWYSRNSYVTGGYGSGTEIGSGFNWFIVPGKSNLRFTLDAAWLESTPADQNRTGFVAGQTGLLIRTQINMAF
ncbi:MAG: porin [Planctomycetaceae bacterium]